MSLDVYLTVQNVSAHEGSGIFVRLDGRTQEVTREEWDKLYPGREPVVIQSQPQNNVVFSANITHNLGRMAEEAGICDAMWEPEKLGITKAIQLIEPLRDGLALLQSDPVRFKKFNPANGWGTYDGFIQIVAEYLSACMRFPDADVSVWR